jgi:hypothetical protein
MKLWHIAQWGNARENDGNEADTNVIVRADDLLSAVELAEENFKWWNEQFITKDTHNHYLSGKANVAFLLCDNDSSPDDKSKVVIRPWIANAFNLGGYKSWGCELNDGKWLTSKELYGEE